MSNLKNKIQSNTKKNSTISFQSDIVIDEEGEVFVSFFGPELMHLLQRDVKPNGNTGWSLPLFQENYFNKELSFLKAEYCNCTLCPKKCGFDRINNSHTNCGNYELKVSNHGISFGDEKVISNGGGSGVIFLNGCPLTCPSCINEEKVRDERSETTIVAFLRMCESLYLKGANNIQILSPSVSYPQIRLILKILKDLSFPLPIIIKSSGYENVDELKKLRGLVDIYLPDYKFFNNSFWEKKSGADNYHEIFVECLKEMYSQTGPIVMNAENQIIKGVMVRHVLNPYIGINENKKIEDFLKCLGNDIFISIQNNFVVLE